MYFTILIRALSWYWEIKEPSLAMRFFGTGYELGREALSLVQGHGFSSPFPAFTGPTAFMAPGYPLLVAAVFKLCGPYSKLSAEVVLAIQCTFSVLTTYVIIQLGQKLIGDLGGVLAGFLSILAVNSFYAPFMFWETALTALVIPSAVLMAIWVKDSSGLWSWIAFGMVWALAALTNASTLLIFPLLLLWVAWMRARDRREWMKGLAISFALAGVMVLPWVVRNFTVFHHFVPLRSNLGMELWMGNRADGDGYFDIKYHPVGSQQELSRYAQLGEMGYMKEKMTLAKEYIFQEPGHFVELSARRFARYWVGIDRNGVSVISLPIILLAAVGLILLFQANWILALAASIPILVYPLPFYVTHPDLRFRQAVEPVLFVFAAYLITKCLEAASPLVKQPEIN